MANIVIFFGAGAEVDFNISSGDKFALNVLGLGNNNTENPMDSAIKDSYNEKYKKMIPSHQEWYPSKFQIVSFTEKELQRKLLCACYRKKALDEQIHSQVLTDDRINEEIDIHSQQESREVINSHTSYMGIVDGYFHTLISPNLLGPQKFCTVMAFYSRAYLSIVKEILMKDNSCDMSYQEILAKPVATVQQIKRVIKEHGDFNRNESYYSLLKKKTDKNIFSIITTNYTPCCEILSGIGKDRIAFVHGRFGLFESPYNMEVIDVEETDYPCDTNILFPYIFIQSGIKPIVEKKQLLEYAKALNFINEADRIVIIGYSINVDDNHLNSLLRDAIISGKETVYLDYSNVGEDRILRRLRLSVVENNFVYKPINKQTALETFKKWIQ